MGGGGESKSGKGLDDGRVEARVVERGGGGGIGRKRMREAAATAAEADVGVEENNDYYENEEENGGAHHDLAVVGILGFNVWLHSSHDDGERVKRVTSISQFVILVGALLKVWMEELPNSKGFYFDQIHVYIYIIRRITDCSLLPFIFTFLSLYTVSG